MVAARFSAILKTVAMPFRLTRLRIAWEVKSVLLLLRARSKKLHAGLVPLGASSPQSVRAPRRAGVSSRSESWNHGLPGFPWMYFREPSIFRTEN